MRLPRHGSRARYRRLNCRCVRCTKQSKDSAPTALQWPYNHLEKAVGTDLIEAWYDKETISRWKAEGLGDYEADEVAIRLRKMAHMVWPGWTEAGIDCDVYP